MRTILFTCPAFMGSWACLPWDCISSSECAFNRKHSAHACMTGEECALR